jgi:hypothetical protein
VRAVLILVPAPRFDDPLGVREDRDSAPAAEVASHGESDCGPEQASVSGAPLSILDWLERHSERMPSRRCDWPAEAERPRERLKYRQAIAVELLVSGMTITGADGQLGVDLAPFIAGATTPSLWPS